MECVCEIMEHSSGLRRNIAQCLDDFGIPLYLEHTIVEIKGKERVESVVIAQVDKAKKPISGTEREIACDTVLFSVGLIPENELSKGAGLSLDARTKGCVVDGNRETDIPGIFACGNVLHVHDLVDFVSEEAEVAGRAAAEYLSCGEGERAYIPTVCVKAYQQEQTLYICIEDNGIGMSDQVKRKLFDAFFTTKPVGEGTGLGLSITRDIIEVKHHGQIKFESEENKYTRFTISIPMNL